MTGKKEFELVTADIESLASLFRPKEALIEVNLVGERRMARLNRAYKNRRGAAEILTFSYLDDETGEEADDGPAGEIYICWKKLMAGAEARRVSRKAYLLRLVVHGLCHLEGYSHDSPENELKMEKAEKRRLAGHLPERVLDRLFE